MSHLRLGLPLCIAIAAVAIPFAAASQSIDLQQRFDEGRAALEAGDYGLAVAAFTLVIEGGGEEALADDSLARVFWRRGVAYRELGSPERALADLDRAVALDDGFATAYYDRALVQRTLGADSEAIVDLSRAIVLPGNNDAAAYRERGAAQFRQGAYQAAIDDYSAAIDLDPGATESHLRRGAVYAGQAQFGLAIQDYNRALALDDGNAFGYLLRGIARARLGQHGDAVADFERALAVDPDLTAAAELRDLSQRALTLDQRPEAIAAPSEPPPTQSAAAAQISVGTSYAATVILVRAVYIVASVDGARIELTNPTPLGTFVFKGELIGKVLSGTWTGEDVGSCEEKRDGTSWWGTFTWTFNEDFSEFDAQSIECERGLRLTYHGVRQ